MVVYDFDKYGNPIYMHRVDPTGRFVPLESDGPPQRDWFWWIVAGIVVAFVATLCALAYWA